MAEGDTVHRIARRLRPAIVGRELLRAAAPNLRSELHRRTETLLGRSVEAVEARGKNLLVRLSGGRVIHAHMGMSGVWHLYRPEAEWSRPPGSAWVILGTEAADAVMFGGSSARLLRVADLARDRRISGLGPDPLAEGFDPVTAIVSLRASSQVRELGDALLDQRLLAGAGNVLKSEACFAAGISPWRTLSDLTDAELRLIVENLIAVMTTSLDSGRRPTRIYRRAGRPCPRCGSRLASRGQGDANRTTYWCDKCQR